MKLPEFKLICTDIDGTLLNKDRWLSEETISAFAKAKLPTILASSRPPQAMRYLQEGLGISNSSLISYNGGLIIGDNGNIIADHSFPVEVLNFLISHHGPTNYNLSIYSHEYWFTDREDEWTKREINNTRATPEYKSALESLQFLQHNDLGIHKLMCMGDPNQLDILVSSLSPVYGNMVHLYRSKDTYLEITPKNIDKAKALEKLLAAYYGFGLESVIAFGDNHNDMELIRQVGLGVAVSNATNELKAIADHVSPLTNKQDAVARTIETLILK